jgi:flagellar protein FlaJ
VKNTCRKRGEPVPGLEELKKKISSGRAGEKRAFMRKEAPSEAMDFERVEKIVDRMKKKYTKQGIEFEEVSGKLGELRGTITSGEYTKIRVQSADELAEFRSPLISRLGKFYLFFKRPVDFIIRLIRNLPFVKGLAYNLYSANVKYSVQQYLVLTLAVSAISFLLAIILFSLIAVVLRANPFISAVFSNILVIVPLSLVAGGFVFVIAITLPESRARRRADAISMELPFALRHMATELRSGIGLYKTLQAIAMADYGILSEEFSRTITEIEEGTDTKDALRHFALRTKSKALRNALLQIIRALKTGGNLSGVMNQIAEDVSFELGMKIRDFGEKMNFFGVTFIVFGIVLPVFITIFGAIFNTPLSPFTLNPLLVLLFYILIMPFILLLLVVYLKIIEPKV